MNDQILQKMELNVGRDVSFPLEDGTFMSGRITGVSNEDHYTVLVDFHGNPWDWYVRSEAVRFI